MPNKHNTRKEHAISIVITMLFILGFILIANSASFTGYATFQIEGTPEALNNTFDTTGELTGTYNVTLNASAFWFYQVGNNTRNFTLANTAPFIPLANITTINDQSITLDSYTSINASFVACDQDGLSEISVYANFTGEDNFYDSNLSCQPTGWSNTTCAQYNCSFNMCIITKQDPGTSL